MTPTKPYLIRAFYEWILDNQMTPYIAVNADFPGAQVPRQFVEAGKITLNISPNAIRELAMKNEALSFTARFSGVVTSLFIPTKAVLAIYARENGRGMVFGEEDDEGGTPPPSTSTPTDKANKPKLTIVK